MSNNLTNAEWNCKQFDLAQGQTSSEMELC